MNGGRKMENVLYIDCCIRQEGSRTRALAEHFLGELEKTGKYAVTRLCLMDEGLSYMTEGFFRQRDELLAKKDFAHPRFRYAHQFAEADKIVVAAPFWDLSFPALLKVYIENLCVEGITFKTGEKGLEGLCKASRLLYLTTRGGYYAGTPLEMGSRYMEAMAEFFGIGQYGCIAAEGLDIGLVPAEELMAAAMKEAEEAAKAF